MPGPCNGGPGRPAGPPSSNAANGQQESGDQANGSTNGRRDEEQVSASTTGCQDQEQAKTDRTNGWAGGDGRALDHRTPNGGLRRPDVGRTNAGRGRANVDVISAGQG